LCGPKYAGTEGGRCEVLELEGVYQRRLEIDEALADAVAKGRIVVEVVSDEESRSMLRTEVMSLHPSERPSLNV
jgi:hypothetical protein